MKILRLVYEWPPPWDGLTPGPYELTQAQLKLGHKVVVFCGGGFKTLGLRVQPSEGLNPNEPNEFGRLQVFRFPRALRRFSIFLTTAPAVWLGYLWLKLTGRGPDLVHGHGHITLWFNLYKLLFGWLDKTPYVLHLHITAAGREKSRQGKELDSLQSKESNSGESAGHFSRLDFWTKYFEWPLHKFSDWLGVRVADRVICVSSRVMEEAIEFYGAGLVELRVVENGVNTTRFIPDGGNLRSEFGWEDAQVLFYNGRLSQRKNTDLIIKSLMYLPANFKLLLVGSGSSRFEDYLVGLVRENGLEDRVKFCGYIPYPELSPYFRTADLFVIPSAYEGFPKVVLQSLACGVPVLASGFGFIHIVDGFEFLKDLQPEAIAERIQRIGDLGVEVDVSRVNELYSWDRKVQEIENVYQSLQ